MNPERKFIFDAVADVIKLERKRTADIIKKALPPDHRAIPALAIANLNLLKSDIREYCTNLMHRKSVVVEVKGIAPYYLKNLD